ncbi:AAA family ATPase [Thermodesulfovibrio hydrogeniphilus]
MKPISLKIAGLNSFVEEQFIDFEKLTSKGLFGIFGPTGSGKSTIIEAIVFSLYGKIPRNSRDFINSLCNSMFVSFEFELTIDGQKKKYIVERKISRDTKKSTYKTVISRLRERGDTDNILAEKERELQQKIIELIGLTADDFTRSVVLPQGKFSEFLKLTGRDRRDMLERIFGLEKYGNRLVSRIREMRKEKENELSRIDGILNQYEGVSREALEDLTKKYNFLQEEEQKLREQREKIAQQREKLKEVWDKQQELKQFLMKKKEFDERLAEVELSKKKLQKAENANYTKPYIDSLKETEKTIENTKSELKKCSIELEQAKKELSESEKLYNIALKQKEEQIPVLIEKEEKLKRAFKLREDIKLIKSENDKLEKEIQKIKKQKEKLESEINKISNLIDDYNKQLINKEDELKARQVAPEIKEKIFYGYEIQKEFERLEIKKKEKEDKIAYLNALINNLEKERLEREIILRQKEEERKGIEETIVQLENKKPPTNEELLSLQQELGILTQKIIDYNEKAKKMTQIEEELKKIVNEKSNIQAEINKFEQDIKEKQANLEKLKDETEKLKIQNIAAELAESLQPGIPCPVCGSTQHIKLAQKIESEKIKENEEILKNLENEIKQTQNIISELCQKTSKLQAREDMFKESHNSLSEELKNIDITQLENQKLQIQESLDRGKEELNAWMQIKNELESSLKKLKDEITGQKLEHTKITENIKNNRDNLDELAQSLKETTAKYEELKIKLDNARNELGIEDFRKSVEEITESEKIINKLVQEIEKLRKKVEEAKNNKESLQARLNNEISIQLAQKNQQLTEQNKNLNEKLQELNILTEGKDLDSYFEEVKKEKEQILNNERISKETFEKAQKNVQEKESKKVSLLEKLDLLNNMLKDKINQLNQVLAEKGFKDKEEALNNYLTSTQIEKLKQEIKAFDDSYALIINNIDRLTKFLQGRQIDEQEWLFLEERLKEIEKELTEKSKEIGALKQTLTDMTDKLQKVEEYTKQKNELEKEVNMLNELDRLFEGNKFVEFVATRQLRHITLSATRRMKEISRGRYAIELSSDNNFVIRDDLNSGVRRSVETLSGGETFLASLALALALSSQIQLKGRAPLEFFFLDEGFGSLDSEILDIVMTSLERLRQDKISVGIISHLDELKNRVPIKLIVTPPNSFGEGSKVRIDYT